MASTPARAPGPFSLPFSLRHLDPDGPLAVEATIVAWAAGPVAGGGSCQVRCALGDGTLEDVDKGRFPLQGLELVLESAPSGLLAPGLVANPGILSEFQQEWLLDAVCSVLNDLAARLPFRS